MPITPTTTDTIEVGYIDDVDGYVRHVSIADANTYAETNPETAFIFIDGAGKTRYLSIDQVNALTPNDLQRPESCDSSPKPISSPTINIFGGSGVGAEGNPIIDTNGNIIAVDIVNGGFGYTRPPTIQVIDPATDVGTGLNGSSFVGSGAVIKAEVKNGSLNKAIVVDGGQGYQPPAGGGLQDLKDQDLQTLRGIDNVPQYPALLRLSEVRVQNPGINYSPEDELTITPNNSTILKPTLGPFGNVESVKVSKGGTFTDLPDIYLPSTTGVNASFTPVFEVIRDPLLAQVATSPSDIVRVYDLIGLNINGYIDGKPYYGNIFYENGIKFAGIKERSNPIRVYENRQSSIAKKSILVGFVDGKPYYGDSHRMAKGGIMTGSKHTSFSKPITKTSGTQITSSKSTSESSSNVGEIPEQMDIAPRSGGTVTTRTHSRKRSASSSPSPDPTPSPTPPSPPPTPPSGGSSDGGGYGGY